MRASLFDLFNSVRKLKFSSKLSTFKLYILSFLVVELVSVSIVLYFFLTGFILSRSINDSDMYELPQPVPKSILHLTPFIFNIATGYVTLVSVVTNIDLLSANLSHIDVWCLFLHFKQVSALRHSTVLRLVPVQLKQSFLLLNILLRSVMFFAVLQSEDIWSSFSQYTHSLLVCLAW